MTCTPRWTGCCPARTTSRNSSPAGTCARAASPCSTCPPPGWRARCELAARGYSRDGKRGRAQIEYGLLTGPEGQPVAVRVFAGNTADPKAFPEAVTAVRGRHSGCSMVMVGDRGMITTARIKDLKKMDGMAWITCLRHPAIKKLMQDDGPLQLSLFDEQDLAEITSDDFPGERLIACRNPVLAGQRARTREGMLAATEQDLGKLAAQVAAGRLKDPDKIALRAGKVHQQAEDGQAHRPRHRRQGHHLAPRPGIHRRRGGHRRDLRHPHPRPGRHPRRGRHGGGLQGPQASNATSGPSRPTTWTCGRSGTGSKTGSAPTC